MQTIARGIFYENSYLGVTVGGLVFSHGVILIDAPLRAEDARSWRSALLNQRGGTNRLLVNLDSHPDRTLGARAMDCSIVAHQRAAQAFRSRPTIFKGQGIETGADWEMYGDVIGMRWAAPDITFTQCLSLHWGGPEVLLEHHPGPAPGSIWVIIAAERVAFVGDTVVLDQPPFLENADLTAWIESLELLSKSYRDYLIVSGRGGPAPTDAVRDQLRVLKHIMRNMDRLARKNASPEATEDLIPALLAGYSLSSDLHERYTQRLRFGLYQYYARRYHPASSLEPNHLDEEEQ